MLTPCILRGMGRVALLLWGGLIASNALAERGDVDFSIKPRLCVLAEGEESCNDKIDMKWKAKTRRNLCLYQEDQTKPMMCWQKQENGQHEKAISASKNTIFELREQEEDTLVAQQEFQVLQNNIKYRHRRRNAWSFF